MKCHQPTLTVGLPKIFKRAGFTVGFVDEAYTSKTCSKCKKQTLGKFLQVKNPRYQCQQQREERKAAADPTYVKKVIKEQVLSHGHSKCSQCKSVWLRDRNAGINIREVTMAVASGLPRPSHLPVSRFPPPAPPQSSKKRNSTSRSVVMAQGRANKKTKKEQAAAVVPVMAIKTLTTDITTQSSQPGITTQMDMVCLSINLIDLLIY
jgi:hypothetical protein